VILSEQEAEKLIQFLRGYLWHTTSIDGFRQISAQNSINVNRGDLQNAYTQSECSNCYEENAVSLFDFVTHRDRDLIGNDLLLLEKWPGVMFRHQPTIFLGMELGPLAPHLLFYPELKRRRGLGGIIPRIEVCHVGNIPFDRCRRLACGGAQRLRIFPSMPRSKMLSPAYCRENRFNQSSKKLIDAANDFVKCG